MKLAEALQAAPRSGTAINRTGSQVLAVTVWDEDALTQTVKIWVLAVQDLTSWAGYTIYDGWAPLEEVEEFLADPSNRPPTYDADKYAWEVAPWEP